MRIPVLRAAVVFLALTGCVETAGQLPDLTPIGAAGQEQVCAAQFASELDVPMSEIRVAGTGTSAVGNSLFTLRTFDQRQSATCEITDNGIIVALNIARG